MHPGSFFLVVLLVISGQCQRDIVKEEIQILKELFQNETTYDVNDGCDAVLGSIESCVDCYPCGHDVITTTNSLKDIQTIQIRKEACETEAYLNLCCISKGTSTGISSGIETRADLATCGMRQTFGARVEPRFGATDTEDTIFGEFPWVVAIQSKCDGQDWQYRCVGTLINSRAVLTAAHCVCGLQRQNCILNVRAGEHQFSTDQERFPNVEVEVEKVIKHEKFYDPGLHNDIALLILKDPIDAKPHIRFACLPNDNMQPDLTQNCIVAGWGVNSKGRRLPRRRDVMRSIKMVPIEREECQNQLRTGPFGIEFNLHESFRCASSVKGKHILKGDGGAALICPLKGADEIYVQYGIVAYGKPDGLPNLFTDTTKFRGWIDENVNENIKNSITDSYVI